MFCSLTGNLEPMDQWNQEALGGGSNLCYLSYSSEEAMDGDGELCRQHTGGT